MTNLVALSSGHIFSPSIGLLNVVVFKKGIDLIWSLF